MTRFSLNLKGRLIEYDHPVAMGILNATPDSFFPASRIGMGALDERVKRMIEDGVDIIDVGAYSSRPGAEDVGESEEIRRLEHAVSAVRKVSDEIPISVDTFRARVAERAVNDFGANIINDISGGDLDPGMFETIASLHVPYVLMHMRGTPKTMVEMTHYDDVTADVIKDLSEKVRKLSLLGVADIIIDPGFGFAKTVDQNYELMTNLPLIQAAFPHRPILVGISRKSMLTKLLGIKVEDALEATVALDSYSLTLGASILRVHDVKAAKEQIMIFNKLEEYIQSK